MDNHEEEKEPLIAQSCTDNLTDVFATVDDLAMLVKRLAHSLKKANPNSELPAKAMGYLTRKKLQGMPLRKIANL